MGLWSLESWFESRPRSHFIFRCELRFYAAVTRAFRADCAVRTRCLPRCDKYFAARSSKCSNSRGVTAEFRDNWRAVLRRAGLLRGGMGSSKPNLFGIAPKQGLKWARHYSQLARLSRGNEGLNRVTGCAQIQRGLVVPARNMWCHQSFSMVIYHSMCVNLFGARGRSCVGRIWLRGGSL